MTAQQDALRSLWRDLAEKGIEMGIDWPYIARTLFRDLDRAEADVREKVAREIEAIATTPGHAADEPVFIDAALVARGKWGADDAQGGRADG